MIDLDFVAQQLKNCSPCDAPRHAVWRRARRVHGETPTMYTVACVPRASYSVYHVHRTVCTTCIVQCVPRASYSVYHVHGTVCTMYMVQCVPCISYSVYDVHGTMCTENTGKPDPYSTIPLSVFCRRLLYAAL
jgi:hypothetical protein